MKVIMKLVKQIKSYYFDFEWDLIKEIDDKFYLKVQYFYFIENCVFLKCFLSKKSYPHEYICEGMFFYLFVVGTVVLNVRRNLR